MPFSAPVLLSSNASRILEKGLSIRVSGFLRLTLRIVRDVPEIAVSNDLDPMNFDLFTIHGASGSSVESF